jgi:hypothetical protein
MNAFVISRYVIWLIGLTVLFIGASILLVNFTGFDIGGGASFVPPLAASMAAGQAWFRRYDTMPSKPDAWKVGGIFTAIHLIWVVLLIVSLVSLFPDVPELAPFEFSNPTFVIIMVTALLFNELVVFFICRFFYRFGAKQQAKAATKAAAKADL